ncbi:MAG: hypothetical protein OXI64_12475 [Defluviicoccus sp.]|nr:hypothetical protein [Defluviicoccus sp.]
MTSIAFAPMFDWIVLAAAGALALGVLALCAVTRARGLGWRSLALAALWLALANPALVEEEREPIPDLVTVVVDESDSQKIDGRRKRSEYTLEESLAKLKKLNNLDVRVIWTGSEQSAVAGTGEGTRLFEALGRSLSSTSRRRMAGTVLLTDGQVHDVPGAEDALPFAGPLHVLLNGRRGEHDRILFVDKAPSFGLVGTKAQIEVRIEDAAAAGGRARLSIARDGKQVRRLDVTVGAAQKIEVEIDHAGFNIFELEVEGRPGELTTVNNRNVVEISGVRERLRVLLVSGEPHPGGRVWRNFLKADPSVDLVHFTILRPPEKLDATPVRELSLIAFPIRELFEVKLEDFDLIIFDRYRRRGVLPAIYLDNIARFVEKGGAVLEVAGPGFASALSLYRTPLGEILPGAPTGQIVERGFKPVVTDIGGRHPVTADLFGEAGGRSRWGRWFRHIEVGAPRGTVLMHGAGERPLLIVDRVGEGRVAQFLSDHIWLWARGFETGGPHSEILRRLSHWLMKEPDLEENDLRVVADGRGLTIVRRSLDRRHPEVEVTAPSGKTISVSLEEEGGGRARATVVPEESGLYRVTDGERTALTAVRSLNPVEFADMRTTADKLSGVAARTGGGIEWLSDGLPSFRRVRPDRLASGPGWMGLVANRDYRVTSIAEIPVLPPLVLLLLGVGALMLAWRREGR